MRGAVYERSSHSIGDMEYHIVFCAKYRYKVLCSNIVRRCIKAIGCMFCQLRGHK
ncbi:MAG: transposase [Alphaproteobacteria bacterium]|nr:transposase [Alphaproteobacteria bacterium]